MKIKLVIVFLISACLLAAGCGGARNTAQWGGYRVIETHLASTVPPVTVTSGVVITYPPVLSFPPSATALYSLCVQDIALRNGIDAGT